MGRKSKYSIEEKVKAVLDYKKGVKSYIKIMNDLGMSRKNPELGKWVKIYDNYGDIGFLPKDKNKSYSKTFKESMVYAYLNGEGSYDDLAFKNGIPSSSTLKNWVMKYNSHIELKDYNPEGDAYMTKSRKTTLEERIAIVTYCLENNKAYTKVAKQYDVSYTQVYQWVQKYLENGKEGLIDRRGKSKPDEAIDELTLIKRENERLKMQLEMKEMENQLLKKVKEIERRRYSPKGNKK